MFDTFSKSVAKTDLINKKWDVNCQKLKNNLNYEPK